MESLVEEDGVWGFPRGNVSHQGLTLLWPTGGANILIFGKRVFSLGKMTLTLCFILIFQACSHFAPKPGRALQDLTRPFSLLSFWKEVAASLIKAQGRREGLTAGTGRRSARTLPRPRAAAGRGQGGGWARRPPPPPGRIAARRPPDWSSGITLPAPGM